jgi:hypothetical protein
MHENVVGIGALSLEEEAKAIVAYAFRSGLLEGLHAGKTCPHCSGKREISHVNNDEMKELMKDAVNRVAFLLELRKRGRGAYESILKITQAFYTTNWEDPDANFIREEFDAWERLAKNDVETA